MLTPPLSFTWLDLVDSLVAERGSLAELVRSLYDIHPEPLPEDPQTVERGLRRLRKREGPSGDTYGRMLLRHFGLPPSAERWARELGQYHSRLGELPTATRRDQLRLWDRAPVSESPQATWIHIAHASLAHDDGDRPTLERRLRLAALTVKRAGAAAQAELALFRARVATDDGNELEAEVQLGAAKELLDDASLSARDRACIRARHLDQRAYRCARGWRDDPTRLQDAADLYTQIPSEDDDAFVIFRHHHGLSWCRWRQQRDSVALRHADAAAEVAGDGGFLHLRAMALRLWARILGASPEADALLRRAARIGASLDEPSH